METNNSTRIIFLYSIYCNVVVELIFVLVFVIFHLFSNILKTVFTFLRQSVILLLIMSSLILAFILIISLPGCLLLSLCLFIHFFICIYHFIHLIFPSWSVINPSNAATTATTGSMKTGWPSQTDSDDVSNDENNCHYSQHHQYQRDDDDDDSSSSDSSFLADTDFASAVARAAELSGLTVVGTTVTDSKNSKSYSEMATE